MIKYIYQHCYYDGFLSYFADEIITYIDFNQTFDICIWFKNLKQIFFYYLTLLQNLKLEEINMNLCKIIGVLMKLVLIEGISLSK